jgi:hypothetical protein
MNWVLHNFGICALIYPFQVTGLDFQSELVCVLISSVKGVSLPRVETKNAAGMAK